MKHPYRVQRWSDRKHKWHILRGHFATQEAVERRVAQLEDDYPSRLFQWYRVPQSSNALPSADTDTTLPAG